MQDALKLKKLITTSLKHVSKKQKNDKNQAKSINQKLNFRYKRQILL